VLRRNELRMSVSFAYDRPVGGPAIHPGSRGRGIARVPHLPIARICVIEGFIGSTNYDDDIEYSFAGHAGVVGFVQQPKGVTVRITFDTGPAHPEAQQRQGWQAILKDFTKHFEASQ
jgi:hypothetical protein